MIIESDNKELKKHLDDLEAALVGYNAWFHPQLALIDRGGAMSVQIEGPLNPSEVIMKVPQRLFVSADDLNVSLKGNVFSVDPNPDKLTAEQIDIGKRMIDIYNITDKATLHRGECPWILYRECPELLDKLTHARTPNKFLQEKQTYLHNLPGAKDEEDFTCWSFLQTRVLGQKSEDTHAKQQVMMPVIDYLNHDGEGCPFIMRKTDDHGNIMDIQNRQPYFDRRECCVSYGTYDTLDTFLSYGFPDISAPFVRSIPVDVEIEGFGTMHIGGMLGAKNDSELPKEIHDLRRYMPVPTRRQDGSLSVSHIIITIGKSPHALRRVLQVMIRSFIGQDAAREVVIDNVYAAEDKIIKENIAFYESMLKSVQTTPAPDHLKDPIALIAQVQLNKLYKYMYDFNFFNVGKMQQPQPAVAAAAAAGS